MAHRLLLRETRKELRGVEQTLRKDNENWEGTSKGKVYIYFYRCVSNKGSLLTSRYRARGSLFLMSSQGGVQLLAKSSSERKTAIESRIFGEKVGLIAKLFGCGHRDLSRPFGQGKLTYRTCLQCGARKRFNPETLETFGGFYYPPAVDAHYQKA